MKGTTTTSPARPEGRSTAQLWRVDADGVESLLLDQNAAAERLARTSRSVSRSVSPDGRLLAYSVDVTGDEVYELRFRDLTTGDDLPDHGRAHVLRRRLVADSSTFFYVVHDDVYRPYQVWRHRVGTPSSSDILVFEDLDKQYDVVVWADRAGHYVVISLLQPQHVRGVARRRAPSRRTGVGGQPATTRHRVPRRARARRWPGPDEGVVTCSSSPTTARRSSG